MDKYKQIRVVEQLVHLDPSELTPEEKHRVANVSRIPETVRNILLERLDQIDRQFRQLEAEGDQIKDFLQGFWRK